MGRRWARVWLGKGWLSGCSRKPDSLALAPIYAGHDGSCHAGYSSLPAVCWQLL
jgi:hypothetical protein